jgi:hypothetical protein
LVSLSLYALFCLVLRRTNTVKVILHRNRKDNFGLFRVLQTFCYTTSSVGAKRCINSNKSNQLNRLFRSLRAKRWTQHVKATPWPQGVVKYIPSIKYIHFDS